MQVPVELKIKYLDRRIQDIEKLKSLLEQDDYSFAAKLGHQVKGNAVTFEVPQIAQIGVDLEKAAILKDKAQVNVLAGEMKSIIESEQKILQ